MPHSDLARVHTFSKFDQQVACAGSEGGGRGGAGGLDPPEKSQNIGFLNHFCLDPLKKKHTQNYQANIQCWAIISTPAKRHLNGVSLTGRCWPAYSGIWIFPPLINLKNPVKIGPPLAKFSGSAHEWPL